MSLLFCFKNKSFCLTKLNIYNFLKANKNRMHCKTEGINVLKYINAKQHKMFQRFSPLISIYIYLVSAEAIADSKMRSLKLYD